MAGLVGRKRGDEEGGGREGDGEGRVTRGHGRSNGEGGVIGEGKGR